MLVYIDDTFQHMKSMTSLIKPQVEDILDKSFYTWDLLDYSLPTDEQNAYYRLKIRTDDNGFVKVETAEKGPGNPVIMFIEDYDRGRVPIHKDEEKEPSMMSHNDKNSQIDKSKAEIQEVSEIVEFEKSFSKIQELADIIKQDIQSQLSKTFGLKDSALGIWELMDYSYSIDPENSYVRMKVKTEDNGFIMAKAIEKEAEKKWDVIIEEYRRGERIRGDEDRKQRRGDTISQGIGSMKGPQGMGDVAATYMA